MNDQLLSELYRRFQREIYLYVLSLCRNAALAEDLTQETFLKALLSLSDTHANMRAWLYMVARNLCLNHLKKQKKELSLSEFPNLCTQSEPLLDSLIAQENRRMLYQSLSHLELAKREVLLLQYFSGLSQKEIAAILHITPENVRVLAFRARKELKKYLEVNSYDIS